MGRFGLELDLAKLDDASLETISKEICLYKKYQQDIHQGDLYRLLSPYKGRTAAYEIVSENRVLVFVMNVAGAPNQAPVTMKLQGLDPSGRYVDCNTGAVYHGSTLMGAGIPIDTRHDHTAFLLVFDKQP